MMKQNIVPFIRSQRLKVIDESDMGDVFESNYSGIIKITWKKFRLDY